MDNAGRTHAGPALGRLLRRRGTAKRRRDRLLTLNTEDEIAIFFARWLRAPQRIGAVAPSSRFLARAMATQVDLHRPEPVIELGGGTGSVTKALLEAGLPVDRLIVVERDVRLYKMLRRRFPGLRVVRGDARHLVELLRPLGIDAVSAVVSSLPLIAMPKTIRRQIISECFALLGAGGRFIQYTYSLTSPLAGGELGLRGRVAARVWLNVPPAAVWSYRLAVA
jgi:phosphatidylethanolamine/phosphatidyl-N-methylethanolamine N-methyltransferase